MQYIAMLQIKKLPYEIEEIILMYLDTCTIRMIGKDNLSEYVWLRKKDQTVKDAARDGNLIGLKYLVEHCYANINTPLDDYALILSAGNGHLEMVKYLVEHGADIHKNDDEALSVSAGNGHLDIVKYLLEKGANLNAEENYALQSSVENGHIDIIKFLFEYGEYAANK
jgi:hypothetical protein